MADFLHDPSPRAFETVVERLLASPHYGERWARHWLDLVRYAETNGHEFDNDKLAPWRYRDYVIRAFNQDVPYNQFVREHLAGDRMPSPRRSLDGSILESPLGTGFLWFGEVLNGATDSVKSRADQVDNQIDVAGKAFLGLTVACARCHDHKFDPIPTTDYYALAGVFHSTGLREGSVDSPERVSGIDELSRRILEFNRRIDAVTGRLPEPPAKPHYRPSDTVHVDFGRGTFGGWTPNGRAFGESPVEGAASSRAAGADVFAGTLTSPQFHLSKQLYMHVRLAGTKAEGAPRETSPLRVTLVVDGYKGVHFAPEGERAVWKSATLTTARDRDAYIEVVDHSRTGHIRVEQIVFSDEKEPPPVEAVPAPRAIDESKAADLLAQRRALEAQVPESAFGMVAGDYQPHNVRVHVRGSHLNLGDEVERRFLRAVAGDQQPPIRQGSGRLEIADWMASPRNPLAARVMVNRIWKHHFGQGIVRTMDNFGASGDRPTHPELLDYLAARFIESGWSVKAMHRAMLLSSAYRMSSVPDAAAAQADPQNRLLSHMPVQRLEAESIRDAMLAVAGTLDPTLYGPSVPPYISKYQDGRGKPKTGPLDGAGRRSLYLQVRRNFLTPLLLAFDYPLPISSIGARGVSTVPSQALLFLNNEFVAGQAQQWALRSLAASRSAPERLAAMYEAAYARAPEAKESADILRFVAAHTGGEEQAWADVAQVLFASPEFIYVR